MKDVLRDVWRDDVAGALYMAADLEAPFFDQCRWLVDRDDRPSAVVTIFLAVETPALVAFGDTAALQQIVQRHTPELPARCYAKLSEPHMQAFGDVYQFSDPVHLDVMMLGELIIRPAPQNVVLREISPADPLSPILQVYHDYPGNYFEPSQLASGRYAGAWLHGRLVSIAGTHAYAPGEGIAVLGNVTTAADCRGQGLAAAVIAFLCSRLRASGCARIGLHVDSDNAAAIAAYTRCGFSKAGPSITQVLAVR
jgi:predicted GNAT family acetyltransferase